MASEQFSLRIPKETKTKLEELAKATGRSKAFLAVDAIEKYCDLEAWQISAVLQGIKDVDEGKFVSMEEVKREWGLK
jgi:RHH-type rel operon transcriptional repressor/antitoxin RelB